MILLIFFILLVIDGSYILITSVLLDLVKHVQACPQLSQERVE